MPQSQAGFPDPVQVQVPFFFPYSTSLFKFDNLLPQGIYKRNRTWGIDHGGKYPFKLTLASLLALIGWVNPGWAADVADRCQQLYKIAEQGYANAQFNLGWMYAQGKGVQQDDVEAAGINVGSKSHFVAVPEKSDEECVREF